MVYKTPFLKKRVVTDYDPSADETKTIPLSGEALSAIWLTIKGDLVEADVCIDELAQSVTSIDVNMGGFNVTHYNNTISAIMNNSILKEARPMLIGNGKAIDDVMGISFPILFGTPYLNQSMALPASASNKKELILGLDIATAYIDDLLISVDEVILPETYPMGTIKQEEKSQAALGTGDHDITLQTNWDILGILFKAATVPVDAAWTKTINRAGIELNDFFWGYNNVDWETLHGEIMDKCGGIAGIENHFHADPSSGNTGQPEDLETWIRLYGYMDCFFHNELKWKIPNAGSKSCKLKLNLGVDEAFYYVTNCYVPNSQL